HASPAPAGTSSARRRRVSHSWTSAAAANMSGAATAAKTSCAPTLPADRPSHRPPALATYATANAIVKGSRRTRMSGRIHAQLSGIRVSCKRVGVSGVTDSIKFEVFFDYQCPFVYRAANLIDGVRSAGRDIEVRWRYFSLTQVNSNNDGWTVWNAPATERVRGRLAFQAAEAARRQGRFEALHMP